jgi:hypothetical protein
MKSQITLADIPFDQEDGGLLFETRVIAVQGGCFWYDDGFEPRLVPLPTASWAEIPVTPEMAQTYGDYAGLYLPSEEMTTDGSLWADAWGIDFSSLAYSVGFGDDEINQIINDYLDSLEASKEASRKAKEAWPAIQAEREKAAKQAEEAREEAREKEWGNYLSIKDRLQKWDRYENSDYYAVTHGIIINERTERFYSEGSDTPSSDGMGSRSHGGYVTVRVVTYQLPSGEAKTLRNPPKPRSEKDWALNHNSGYWTRKKWDIENPKVEAVSEPEPAPKVSEVSENQKLIQDFGAKFPQLVEESLSLGIQIRLTSGSSEERRVVVRSRDLRNGYESFPKDATELHRAVVEAIAFKSQKNELEALKKAEEEQITAQQKESQLPYKTACEKAGYKVEWNQDSYLAKVGKRWTDCQTVCRRNNLSVEFSKKPKLILKK